MTYAFRQSNIVEIQRALLLGVLQQAKSGYLSGVNHIVVRSR